MSRAAALTRTEVSPMAAIVAPAVLLSMGAAAIHFAVIGNHFSEFPLYGVLFALTAWLQAVWALAYGARPSDRLAWLAIALNVGVVVAWAWSRTIGLPVAPSAGMVEPVGAADAISTAFEVLLVGVLALHVSRRPDERTAGVPIEWAAVGAVVLFIAIAAATTYGMAQFAAAG
jgi:hypothetical protein